MKMTKKSFLLAIDIGNTRIHAGLFSGLRLVKKGSIETNASIIKMCSAFSQFLPLSKNRSYCAIISSVVPSAGRKVFDILKKEMSIPAFMIGKDLIVPIKNLYKIPQQVGQDRLVNAFACREIYKIPAIIIDFGTATTFDFLNKNGEYEGGVITPGVGTTIDSLAEKTALLPKITMKIPKRFIGQDTQESIRSGVYYGLLIMCDGIIRKIKKTKNSKVFVVATGGYAEIFCRNSNYINQVDTDLTLKGINLIYSKFYTSHLILPT